jgi:anti-anti-sigma factor
VSAKPLDLSESVDGAEHVVAVRGELDMFSAPELAACLDAALDRGGVRIVVDLTDASFLDSSGIFTLVRAKNRAQQAGGTLRLTCPPGPVLRVLTVAGLIDELDVSERREHEPPDAG